MEAEDKDLIEEIIEEADEDPEWVSGKEEKEEEVKESNGLPEAPASATIRFWINGYGVMLTMRDEKVFPLVDKIQKIIGIGQAKGWQQKWPEPAGSPTPQAKKIDPETCNVDHSSLQPRQVKKEGPNKGKWFVSCDKCNYFKWVKF